MIVHKCDHCGKEMKDRTLKLNTGFGNDLELCSSECVINYLKNAKAETIKIWKDLERRKKND